jgi:hypothetical protein
MNIHTAGKPKNGGLLSVICGQMPRVLLLVALTVVSLPAASIDFQVSTVGATGTYQYFLSGFDFRVNQPCLNAPALECSDELDIQFDPTMFGQLLNGVAGAGFDLLLLQPNNPPQAPGDYSALAVVDHPSLGGPFRVDFTFTGPQPGFQPYSIRQFDSAGNFEGVVLTGTTVPANAVPEPVNFSLCCVGLLVGAVRWIALRRQRIV